MSAIRFIVSYDMRNLHLVACHRSQSFAFSHRRLLEIPRSKHGHSFLKIQRSLWQSTNPRVRIKSDAKMDTTICSSSQPGSQPPPGPPSNSWRNWIFGILLSIILPFWKNKWGPLLGFIKTVEDKVESVTDVVEKVAEEVEKVAEEVADKLPEGGKLKDAITFVENIAKETEKDAQLAEDIINKVEEVEEKLDKDVEEFMESGTEQQINVVPKEAGEQK